MGIHLVERTFEICGPSGLGAAPRPELVGPVLSRLHDTLVDSVRMGYAAAVRTRPGSSPYKQLLGMIPAEESDDDFLIAMEAMD